MIKHVRNGHFIVVIIGGGIYIDNEIINYKYYTCKADRAFKEVFLDENDNSLLIVLLEFILKVKINTITIKNSELNSNNLNVRRKIVDALLYTDKGIFNIEINTSTDTYVKPRNFSYITNAYSSYVLKGEEYDSTCRFVQINLSYNLNQDDLFRVYKVMDENNNTFIDNFEIYDFNIDKYVNFWYTKNKKEIEKNKYLIMLNLPKKELEILSKDDKVVSSYMEKLNSVNEDPRFQVYMSREEDDRKIMNSIKHEYYDKGMEKGLEKGIEEGRSEERLDIVKTLLKKGMSLQEVSDYLDIPIEKLRNM